MLRRRLVLKKLVKLYGFDTIHDLMPAEDRKLLQHVQRMAARSERKKLATGAAARASTRGSMRDGEDSAMDSASDVDSGDDDDDDGASFLSRATSATYRSRAPTRSSAKTANRKRNSERLMIHEGAGVVDLLDKSAASSIAMAPRARPLEESDDVDNVKVDSQGRIVVLADDKDARPGAVMDTGDEDEDEEASRAGKRRKASSVSSVKSSKSALAAKRKLRKGAGLERSGALRYRSKRAGGDVQRQGMMQPFAFIPLDPRTHSKRHASGAIEEYGALIQNRGQGKRGGRRS